jgi:hypothetical protein
MINNDFAVFFVFHYHLLLKYNLKFKNLLSKAFSSLYYQFKIMRNQNTENTEKHS